MDEAVVQAARAVVAVLDLREGVDDGAVVVGVEVHGALVRHARVAHGVAPERELVVEEHLDGVATEQKRVLALHDRRAVVEEPALLGEARRKRLVVLVLHRGDEIVDDHGAPPSILSRN